MKIDEDLELGKKTIEFVQALKEDRYRLNDSRESWVKEKDKGTIWSQSENNEKLSIYENNKDVSQSLKCYQGNSSSLAYVDFEVAKYEFFRSTDFNWSKDTYGQLSRFQKDIAPLLDSEFSYVKTMTDNTFLFLFFVLFISIFYFYLFFIFIFYFLFLYFFIYFLFLFFIFIFIFFTL